MTGVQKDKRGLTNRDLTITDLMDEGVLGLVLGMMVSLVMPLAT
ncbi:hypothetical protein [Litorimonas cladophorae]|nr:hypothetical protein [Litorimonas cladophorae]